MEDFEFVSPALAETSPVLEGICGWPGADSNGPGSTWGRLCDCLLLSPSVRCGRWLEWFSTIVSTPDDEAFGRDGTTPFGGVPFGAVPDGVGPSCFAPDCFNDGCFAADLAGGACCSGAGKLVLGDSLLELAGVPPTLSSCSWDFDSLARFLPSAYCCFTSSNLSSSALRLSSLALDCNSGASFCFVAGSVGYCLRSALGLAGDSLFGPATSGFP